MARVLISGASGLIGRAITAALTSTGDEVYRLVRKAPADPYEIRWDPIQAVPSSAVSGFDSVIHLSGETVAGRWTQTRKRRIRDSRVVTTRNLATALAQAEKPPQVFLCASAIGYYGNRGDEVLTEDSAPGKGFLADTCAEWEEATQPAANAGIRTANLRIGVVLAREGAALKQMLLPFRLGLGGRIGNGRQWFSWIHIDDLVAAVLHTMRPVAPLFPPSLREGGNIASSQPITGPVNMVAPNPFTNAEFTRALARALHRPAVVPVPALALRLMFGEFAEEGPLSSARVIPKKLRENGFRFHYPELGAALQELLRTGGKSSVALRTLS